MTRITCALLLTLLALPALAAPQELVCVHGGDSGDGGCYPNLPLNNFFEAERDPELRSIAITGWSVSGEGEERHVTIQLRTYRHPGKVRVVSTDGYRVLKTEQWFSTPNSYSKTEVEMPLPEGGSVAVPIQWERDGFPYYRALVVSDEPSHSSCCAVLWNPDTHDGYRWTAMQGEVPWQVAR